MDFGIFQQWVLQTLILLAPIVTLVSLLHLLERVTLRQLAKRLGWRAVLWTGWIGTPLHELSHAAMCLVFRHRIDKLVLFEPDLQSGRLGYVQHSYNPKNRFQQLGNVFIGVAPIVGGTAALCLLLFLFFPDAANAAVETDEIATAMHGQELVLVLQFLGSRCAEVLSRIVNWNSLITLRLWVFLYLVLCIGTHMAPSKSDYQGAARGAVLLIGGWLLVAISNTILGVEPDWFVSVSTPVAVFVAVVLSIAVALCALSAAVIFAFTMRWRL